MKDWRCLRRKDANGQASLENHLDEMCKAEQTLRVQSLELQLEAMTSKEEAGRELIKSLQNEVEKLRDRMRKDRECMTIAGLTAFVIIVWQTFELASRDASGM